MTSNLPPQTLHQAALYWLQDQLCDLPIINAQSPSDVPADLPLCNLPGRPRMRQLYAALRKRGVELPPLFLSRLQHFFIAYIAICLTISAAMSVLEREPLSVSVAFQIMIPGLLTWAVLALISKLCFAHISSADTVGELAGQIFACNPMFFSRLSGIKLSRGQIQEIVIGIVVDACGVDREEVTLDTPLAKLMD